MPKLKDAAVESLDRALKGRVAKARLFETLEAGRVRCLACGHRCVVLPGLDGICRVRFNRDGALYAPRGYAAGVQVDPIEKKPFYHVLPGASALSFGMLGCDLHCDYCQNWLTSQALRDPAAGAAPRDVESADLVRMAVASGAPVVVSTYNEPLITAEWAFEVFEKAKTEGLLCGFVSNGNATPEVLDFLRPVTDLYKVDLKGFREDGYRALGGTLRAVLDTLVGLCARGYWVEVVTLVVPGFNDSEAELSGIARFLARLSPEIPWHVTAFHRDYKRTGPRDTEAADLARASAIGREAGLRYVYAGNRPGAVGDLESTFCPGCSGRVVERRGFRVLRNVVDSRGRCPTCGVRIAGIWSLERAA